MRIVVYKNDNSGPIKSPVMIWEESEAQTAEEILSKISPDLDPIIMTREELPKQNFFGAWEYNNKKITVNINTAKEIVCNKFRMERTPLLADLDVQYMRALEVNDQEKLNQIVTKKQQLRDITNHPKLLSAKTPEELSDLTIEKLLG